MALAVCIYLTLMGPAGMERVGHINLGLMHRFRNRIAEAPGVRLAFPETLSTTRPLWCWTSQSTRCSQRA